MSTKQLPFTIEEYRNRLALVRQQMSNLGANAFLINTPEDIFYLTGFKTTGYYSFQALLVEENNDPTLITRHLEKTIVDTMTWIKACESYKDYEDPAEVTAKVISQKNLSDKVIALQQDSWFLT